MDRKTSTHHSDANSTSVCRPSSLPFTTDPPCTARTSNYRLDAQTRAIGLAGVAKARAILAACRPPDDELLEADRTEEVTIPPSGDGGGVSSLDARLCEAA